MSDCTVRDLILLAHIFEPGVQNTGHGAGLIMKRIPELLDWDLEEITLELHRMHEDGLVVPFGESSPGSWKSTPKGRAARELLTRKHGGRAACLCSPASYDLDDLILALAATPETCEGEHSYAPTETLLADYLFDFKDGLQSSIARLEERGLVKLGHTPGSARSGKSLYISVAGFRAYRKDVAGRLRTTAGTCVLDAQPRTVVVSSSLHPLGIDPDVIASLSRRVGEAERCETVDAYLAATVLYGSILEGVLEGLAKKDPKTANSSPAAPKDGDGKPKNFADWKFIEWIAVARDVGWIPGSVGGYVDQLRSYRNLIHVSKQLRHGVDADKHLARVTRSVLDSVLQHVADRSKDPPR